MSTRRLRVWFVITDLNNFGGAPRINHDLMVGLDRDRFEPIQIMVYQLGELGESARNLGVKTIHGLVKSRKDPRLFGRLRTLAHEMPPDVVFTTENALSLFYCALLKRLRVTPNHVAALHTARVVSASAEIAWRFALPRCDRIIALSEQNKRYWQSRTKLPDSRFAIIFNGVDMNRFVPTSNQLALRRELNLPTDRQLVGTMANFNPVKNLTLFVDVAKDLLSSGRKVGFVMAGSGPDFDRIQSYVIQSGLQDDVILPGKVSEPAVWHQALDVEMLTSHSEALPLAAIEALGCGVPFVGTDVGGVRDVVIDGCNGFVVPPGDRAALVDRVGTLLDDTELHAKFSAGARPSVETEFSVPAMVSKYAQVFEEVAGKAVCPR